MSSDPVSRLLSAAFLAAFSFFPAAAFGQAAAAPAVADAAVVTPALKQSIGASHDAWKNQEAAEFNTGLTYVGDVPTLMFITSRNEAAGKGLRRRRAILSACSFLLDDAAFAKANICVVSVDPQNPRKQATVNYEVRRGNFHEALRKLAETADLKAAARMTDETDSLVEGVSATLGLQ